MGTHGNPPEMFIIIDHNLIIVAYIFACPAPICEIGPKSSKILGQIWKNSGHHDPDRRIDASAPVKICASKCLNDLLDPWGMGPCQSADLLGIINKGSGEAGMAIRGSTMGWLPLGLSHTLFGWFFFQPLASRHEITYHVGGFEGKNCQMMGRTEWCKPDRLTSHQYTAHALCPNRANAGILSRRNLTCTLVHLARGAPCDIFCPGFPNLHISACISHISFRGISSADPRVQLQCHEPFSAPQASSGTWHCSSNHFR